MDEIVRKLAGIGLPAVVLLITMASTGFVCLTKHQIIEEPCEVNISCTVL